MDCIAPIPPPCCGCNRRTLTPTPSHHKTKLDAYKYNMHTAQYRTRMAEHIQGAHVKVSLVIPGGQIPAGPSLTTLVLLLFLFLPHPPSSLFFTFFHFFFFIVHHSPKLTKGVFSSHVGYPSARTSLVLGCSNFPKEETCSPRVREANQEKTCHHSTDSHSIFAFLVGGISC